jgi:hypothetical protein
MFLLRKPCGILREVWILRLCVEIGSVMRLLATEDAGWAGLVDSAEYLRILTIHSRRL